MVAMGGGRAAGAPLDEGMCMEGRVALAICGLCQRDPPSLDEMSFDAVAGWLAGVYRAQAVQDVACGRSVRSLVERIRGAGCAAYTTGWSVCRARS